MSSGKKHSTEAPTKRMFSKFLSRKKKEKDGGKRQSTEGIKKDDDDAAGMRTCEEVVEGGAGSPGSPVSIKQKRKKKKKDGGTVEEDDTVKGRKSKDKDKEKDKEKDELKTAKKKKVSKVGKREKTDDAPPQPSGMATVFEKIQAPSRPAIAHNKDINENIKEDIERIDKEEKKEKEKLHQHQQQQIQTTIDEFAPTVFEPIQAAAHPIVTSIKVKKHPRQAISPDPCDGTAREKPLYLSIPKENAITARERKDSNSGSSNNKKMSAESTKTGKEKSNKATKHSGDSQDDADCKTAMIPASAVKIGQYQMVMYKGVPRYEPINKSSRPYEKSEKEVAAKIQILQPPPSSIPTSPTFPGVNNDVVKTPPKSPPVATSPAKNNGNNGGIVIGTLPKNQPSAEDPKKDGLSPVSHYVAPLDR